MAKKKEEKKAKKVIQRKSNYTEKELHELGQSLVDHCKKEDVYHITDWTSQVQNKTYQWWYDLKKTQPILVEYHERAKQILGNKILANGAKSGNMWVVKTFIPKYLDDVRQFCREEMREEYKIKAEVAKEAMTKDPDHPFWNAFNEFMQKQ